MGLIYTCGPEEALVKSGAFQSRPKIISNGYSFRMPCVQQVDRLDLRVMTISICSKLVYTRVGVPITVSSVAVICISRQPDQMRLAADHFLGMSGEEIGSIASQTMEGHQRAIMGTMTIEEIYTDRTKFAEEVEKIADADIRGLGLQILSYTIKEVIDDVGYLEALGKKRIAEVKRDATVGQADADCEATQHECESRLQHSVGQYSAQTKAADSERTREIHSAAYDREVNVERAKAELAGRLQEAKINQELKHEELEIELIRRRAQIEVEAQEVSRRERELEATVRRPALAERYRLEKEAEGQRMIQMRRAEAEAERIRLTGEAEAKVLRMKGEAEAVRMNAHAEAYSQFTDGAFTEMIIKQLPQLANSLVAPLNNTSKIVVVGTGAGGGGAGGIGDITALSAQLPTVVESLTGLDIRDALQSFAATGAPAGAGAVARPKK